MKVNVKNWQAGYVPEPPKLKPIDQPKVSGWYVVDHVDDTWICTTGVYARWDGIKWERPGGWPSKGNELAWTFDSNGELIIANDIRLWNDINVTAWRGKTT